LFANYLRLVVFAFGLLVGVQVPGFVDQYAKRVSAHQLEAVKSFGGFRETADRYFGGNVDALIAHHAASEDPAFKNEAKVIRGIYDRLAMLTAELAALRGPLIQQIMHVLFRANSEILSETRSEYTYTVPLNPPAVVCGVTTGALLAMLIEALFTAGVRLIRPRRTRSTDWPAVR
jgi:hypothetical protein